jgi:hypothetical protein
MFSPGSAGGYNFTGTTFNNSNSSVDNNGHGTAYLYDGVGVGLIDWFNVGVQGNVLSSADNRTTSIFIDG